MTFRRRPQGRRLVHGGVIDADTLTTSAAGDRSAPPVLKMCGLHTFREEVGLPPTREDFFLDYGPPNAVVGLFSPHFAAAQPDHPRNIEIAGFPHYKGKAPGREELEPSLTAFLAAGDAPIVFTLGSFAIHAPGDFYLQSIKAARRLRRRAVLLVGDAEVGRLAAHVGPDEHLCAAAPHALLFPHVSCVVHHGGIGTTAECLRAGRPQLVVPFFGDQPDHAARVERLGVGRSIRLSRYGDARVATELALVLGDSYRTRADHFAGLLSNENGAEAVASRIAQVVAPAISSGRHGISLGT